MAEPRSASGRSLDVPPPERALRHHPRAGDAVPEGRAGLGRAHRLGARPGPQLAADGARLPGAGGGLGRGAGLAIDTRQRRALCRRGRPAGCRAGRGACHRRLSPDRSADRLASRALHRERPPDPGRCGGAAAELASRLRLRHRPRRAGAQRPCPRRRSLRPRRRDPGRRRGLERHPRLGRQLPRRLGRAPLHQRTARAHRALDRDPDDRDPAAARARAAREEPARHLRQRHQLVPGDRAMTPPVRSAAPRSSCMMLAIVLAVATALAACAKGKPPEIAYDAPAVAATLVPEPPRPVKVVEVPKPLPLPGQLKPVAPDDFSADKPPPEPRAPADRVAQANAAARVEPVRDGFIDAIQVYPYTAGALYQVYASPGQITDIGARGRRDPGRRRADRRGRHRALDRRRHRERVRRHPPHPHPRQADPARSRHQPRDQHRSAHLSSRAARHAVGLHGLGLLAVSARRADRARARQRQSRGRRADRPRDRARGPPVPLPDRGRPAAVAAAARLRRPTTGVHRVPARDRPRRDAALVRDRPRGRRPARQLPCPAQLHCRRPAVRRRRAPARAPPAARAHRAHRHEAAVSRSGDDPNGGEVEPASRLDPERDIAAELRLRPEPPRVLRLSRRMLSALMLVVGLGLGGILIVALRDRGSDQRTARAVLDRTGTAGRRPRATAARLCRRAAARAAVARRSRPADPRRPRAWRARAGADRRGIRTGRRRRRRAAPPAGDRGGPAEPSLRRGYHGGARGATWSGCVNRARTSERRDGFPRRKHRGRTPRCHRSAGAICRWRDRLANSQRLPACRDAERVRAPGRLSHPGRTGHRLALRPARPDHSPGDGTGLRRSDRAISAHSARVAPHRRLRQPRRLRPAPAAPRLDPADLAGRPIGRARAPARDRRRRLCRA